MMSNEIPDGYIIEWNNDQPITLIDLDTRANFCLSNRSFEEFNSYFGYLPSRLIRYLIQTRQPNPIHIMDVGGGIKSCCAKDIAEYPWQSPVKVTSIDLLADTTIQTPHLTVLRADACNLLHLIPPASQDFIYSQWFFCNFAEHKYQKQIAILTAVAIALRVGGIGFIHENPGMVRFYRNQLMEALQNHGVTGLAVNIYHENNDMITLFRPQHRTGQPPIIHL